MNAVAATGKIVGAQNTPFGIEQASAWQDWLTGRETRPTETYAVRFALAHSDSGVTWGYLDDQGQWKLSCDVDPGLSPMPTTESLHELRLFGTRTEVLIWRGEVGLQGRVLTDDGTAFDESDPLRPLNEGRCVRGNPRASVGGFVRYVDAGGAEHLVPETLGQLSVRHYFEQEMSTGGVRVAATRLVAASPEVRKGF